MAGRRCFSIQPAGDKIIPYTMRNRFSIPGAPLLKRFHRGRHDRGR